jgi:hypothetical protein
MLSKYQDYFTFSRCGLTANCNRCGHTLKSLNTTSGMKRHLKTHGIEIEAEKSAGECQKKRKFGLLDAYVKKESFEDKIAKEAAKYGATFCYLSRSELVKKALSIDGLNQPFDGSSVRKLVHKCAIKKKEEVKEEIEEMVKNHVRFCGILDEWTSSGNTRYMNVCLDYKGKSINLGLEPVHGSLTA